MLMSPAVLGLLQLSPALMLMIYGWVKQKNFRDYFYILLMALPSSILYTSFVSSLPDGPLNSYFYLLAKFILFSLPAFVIIKMEKYKLGDFGITKKNLKSSILVGLGILIVTSLTNALIFTNPVPLDPYSLLTWSVPLFLDAFNEEFLFRGVFFYFAYKKTKNLALSFIASTIITIAWHPLELIRIIPAVIQGTLLCYLLYKTKNVYGAWVSHGINRSLASVFIRILKP